MTEAALRLKVANTIDGWLGATRGSAKHKQILEIYNNYKPLARGYTVKESDAHCATTVSAAFIKAGIAEYTGTECGCAAFIEIAKKKGTWIENDAYVPKLGDCVLYDWEDSGSGDNTGAPNHIGIVTQTGSTSFVVTEGNMSGGKVGTRTVQVNGKYIRGFIAPDYASIAKSLTATESTESASSSATAANGVDTCTVARGDTLSGIAVRYGVSTADLAALNGIRDPDRIDIGQVLYLSPIGKLAALGVINAPDYWREAVASGKVKYLDLLLFKAAARITGNGERLTDVEKAVQALGYAGVCNAPGYWLEHQGDLPYLGDLLCALGGAVK